jgi:hypothetical protein
MSPIFDLLYRISMEEQKDFAAIPTVFSTKPVTALPTTGGARNFMYCRIPRHAARLRPAGTYGIGFGRNLDSLLKESFDHCVAGNPAI